MDNLNHYAVRFKLGRRKIERANKNAFQIQVYQRLLESIEGRKAPMLGLLQVTQQAYIRPMEVEREFLDSFSVILSSGYYIEEKDFFNLLSILRVSDQSDHAVERAKLLEFFTSAAEQLHFDVKMTANILTEPWERQAKMKFNSTIKDEKLIPLNTNTSWPE